MSKIFATGTIASGSQFIGRRELIGKIKRYLYDDMKNVSLVGLPMSGKSSAAYEAFTEIEKIRDDNILLLRTNLAEYQSFEKYWRDTVIKLYELASERGIKHRVLNQAYKFFEDNPNPEYSNVKSNAESFMKCLKNLNIRLLILVDEFDAAIELFRGMRFYYEFFREMGSSVDMLVRFLVLSRQQIKRVETNAYGNSTLFSIFDELTVHEFSDSEIAEYYYLLEQNAGKISDDSRHIIYHTAGRFPALLSLIGDRLINEFNEGRTPDAASVINQERSRILKIFEAVFKQLQNDKNANIIIQAVIGPRYKITVNDIRTLSDVMGYIFHEVNGRWTIISPEFLEYLQNQKLDIPVWPQLFEAHSALIKLVREKLMKLFNVDKDNLNDAIISRNLIPVNNCNLYMQFIAGNKEKYNVESDLIDVMSIDGLDYIIGQYWRDIFSPCFNGKSYESYWRERFKKLKWARDPVAHAKTDYLKIEDVNEVNAICLEITECLGTQNAHKNSSKS